MTLIVTLLRLMWLTLQLVDTLKAIKKPSPRKTKIRAVDEDDQDVTIVSGTSRRTRMSTLKRDQWRRLLKSWIVWIIFSYVEAIADRTVGMIMPFYDQVKIVFLLGLSIPRSSLKRYARTIDLTTSLLVLVGQYLLQLVLCATVVPLLTTFERIRSLWRGRTSTEEEQDQGDGSVVRLSRRPSPPPPPGGFGITSSKAPSTPLKSRKTPRKSVIENVLEFSLGTPRTLRQTVHQAKALYEGPKEKAGKKSREGPSRLRLQAEQAGVKTKDARAGTSKETAAQRRVATATSVLDNARAVPVQRSISVEPSRQTKTQTVSRSVPAERDPPRPRMAQATKQLLTAAAVSIRAARPTVPNPLAVGIPTLPSKSSLKAAGPSQSLESLPRQNVRTTTVPPLRSAVAGPSHPIIRAQPVTRVVEVIDEDPEDMQGVEYTNSAEPVAQAVSAVGGSRLQNGNGINTVSAKDTIEISGKSTPRKRKEVDTAVEVTRPKARKVVRPSGSLGDTKPAPRAAPRAKRSVDSSVAQTTTATKPKKTAVAAKPTAPRSANVFIVENRTQEDAPPEGRTLRSARRKAPVEPDVTQRSPDPAPDPEPEIRRPKPRAVPAQQPVKRATRNLGRPQRPEHR